MLRWSWGRWTERRGRASNHSEWDGGSLDGLWLVMAPAASVKGVRI